MRPRVLWIEDGARFDLRDLAAHVLTAGNYDLHFAENATSAMQRITTEEFEVVVVDIRIPPGKGAEWIELWTAANRDRVGAQLGLQLLYAVLQHQEAKVRCVRVPWLTQARIAIFTVETEDELREDLSKLGVQVFRTKRSGMPETALLELIELVLSGKGR